MRILRSTGAVVAAAALSLTAAPAAFATNGDNGNVKIHDAVTGEFDQRNVPKVCTFYLDGFKFDDAQKVDWHIEAWAKNELEKGEVVKSGSLTLDGSGHERTEVMTLADGQYKLFWNFDGENGRAKHKVFKVDCPDAETPGGDKPGDDKPGDKPGDDKPGDDGDKSGEDAGSTPSAPAESGDATDPAASESPAADVAGDLAETGNGAPIGVLAAVAAALVAGGGYLVARRRTARQH
ncbi:LPXTG cell wall anchor domain-containing protein [Streptomyces sp. NPDC006274]|uniref:LPXTG cell wall anchor domain-containing protein n=1 Tax=unclassified Streptomyces TaxID=2593676 RepID=UPI0033A7E684